MNKIGPSLMINSPNGPKKNQNDTRKRRTINFKTFMSNRSNQALDESKFEELMVTDFASGFEESESRFAELCTKAADLLNTDSCYIFLKDENDHKIFTFLKDKDGDEVRVTKPLDRGITGYVVSDAVSLQLDDVNASKEWLSDLDEISGCSTKSYLAIPLWDVGSGECIGAVEFRNKSSGTESFTTADLQIARIFASQVGNAVTQSRQKSLLDGRNEAFAKAYKDELDGGEAICLATDKGKHTEGTIASFSKKSDARIAFTLAPSISKSVLARNHIDLSERGWDYDVFLHSEEELTMHAVDIFDERGLFSRFSIPISTFLNFVKEIKNGYSKVTPYHNYYHAFDVMHVCYMFMTKCCADEYLESFNILSILIGSLAHDLGHDGYNNAFHDATNSELAITYNGVSILENYSAAYLFRIFRKDENNILARLNQRDSTKMRSRLIDLILDTDAKNHFTLMTRFKHGLEMKQLSRGLLSSMILHISDVSNPTRPGSVARKWAYAVQEEFFRQGDKEKELKLPQSPFMDRSFENLPRMQEAFIDAVVIPVFTLFAEFLPQVKDHCLKPLHINRAFWNSMQNQDLVKTTDIIAFLNSRQSKGQNLYSTEIHDESESAEISEAEENTKSSVRMTNTPIPGIPASASIDRDQTVRKLSLVSFSSNQLADEELGITAKEKFSLVISLRSPRRSFNDTRKKYAPKIWASALRLIESTGFQAVMLVATFHALFAKDINMAIGDKSNDLFVDIITFCVILLFITELMISLCCIPKYKNFFLWLDLAASISLILEIGFLMNVGSTVDSPDSLGLAKASRAAKAGSRAGRLAKLMRLIRLAKVAKLMKWSFSFFKKRSNDEDFAEDANDTVDMKMSVVGLRMTESITKKVILAVMMMLISFSLLDHDTTPDARQIQLDMLAEFQELTLLPQIYIDTNSNLISLQGISYTIFDEDRLLQLRMEETVVFEAEQDPSIFAVFDIKAETQRDAWYSICLTIIVTSFLAILSLLFSQDAYKIMIRPIERMKFTVQQLSENPLLHLEKMKNGGSKDSNETDILQQAITKMATLLQIGFGCAGAEIIAKSFSDMGELDPMVPGAKVNAIFGFCDIRDFTFATEGLQQDVMLFVNKVAEILHNHVVESEGAPNKNIGDAFLLVWKLDTFENGTRSNLQKDLFDSALLSFQKTIREIQRLGNLAAFIQEETDTSAAWKSSLEDFEVRMGFGLHTGWAIEGSIGSKVKVDASYLSPHVNLASRLENATKSYHVPLLMSEAFVAGLTGTMQSTCRRCDRVTFKGSQEPMNIFHQDTEPFDHLTHKPDNYADLLQATSWNGESELVAAGVDVNVVLKSLKSTKNVTIREVYEQAFNAYLDGKWKKSKFLWHLWMEKFPGDVITHVLVRYLMKYDFDCPVGWKGYHPLTEK